MDINASTLKAVYTGLSTAYNQQFAAVKSQYQLVAMTVTSTTAMNQYPRMDDMPGFREWVGDRIVHDMSAQDYIIKNREFEKTMAVKRSQIEDDQLHMIHPTVQQWGQDAAYFPDQLVFPLFKNGENHLCYDGQNFFDTDHPGFNENGGETSVSNFQAGANPAWYLIDDSQVMKPLVYQKRKEFKLTAMDRPTDPNVFYKGQFEYGVDGRCNAGFGLWQLAYKSKAELNAENFEAARAALSTIRKRDGQVLNIRATKLIVPPVLEGQGRKLLNAEMVDGGDSNIWKGTAELVTVPLLA